MFIRVSFYFIFCTIWIRFHLSAKDFSFCKHRANYVMTSKSLMKYNLKISKILCGQLNFLRCPCAFDGVLVCLGGSKRVSWFLLDPAPQRSRFLFYPDVSAYLIVECCQPKKLTRKCSISNCKMIMKNVFGVLQFDAFFALIGYYVRPLIYAIQVWKFRRVFVGIAKKLLSNKRSLSFFSLNCIIQLFSSF
jgi:hypothetical protein